MEKIKLKRGDRVWFIEEYNHTANLFEGEYLERLDVELEPSVRIVVKDCKHGRHIVVNDFYTDMLEALEEVNRRNQNYAHSNIRISRDGFEKMKTDIEVMKIRISKLEKEKMRKWFV